MARLELDDEVVQGRRLDAAWGDVPDYFHRCETEPGVWLFMVLKRVSAAELAGVLRKRGTTWKPAKGQKFVALKVAIMGWSWAPCLCHGGLEDVLIDRAEGFPKLG